MQGYLKLPPCEDAFKQHVKRPCGRQKYGCHHTSDVMGSPFDFGWKKEDAALTPVLYEGLTTSEVISHIICICKGKDHCVVGCACFQNGLPCTELCTYAANIEKCGNAIPSEFKHDYNEEEE